jgi:hypothetical protein
VPVVRATQVRVAQCMLDLGVEHTMVPVVRLILAPAAVALTRFASDPALCGPKSPFPKVPPEIGRIGACAAFVSYLINKARGASLLAKGA